MDRARARGEGLETMKPNGAPIAARTPRNERQLISCQGKERFENVSAARRVASKRRRRDGSMQTYRCQHCKGFHVGHQNIRRRPMRGHDDER